MNDCPVDRYQALVAAGEIAFDPAQAALTQRLDELGKALADLRKSRRVMSISRLLRGRRAGAPRGVYIHGDVGRGKTMLVDMFYETIDIPAKRRVHFNDFMADVHERLHEARRRSKPNGGREDRPISHVAAALAREAQLLCLDEFHVDDIADAMILGRLFTALFTEGVIAVTTSNVPPDDLYAHGLKRATFLPFIALVKERMDVVRLDAAIDYRLEKLRGRGTWFAPCDRDAEAEMEAAWRRLSGADRGAPATLTVKGRTLQVPKAQMGVARFAFSELCEAPLGPNDFLALARSFHTVLIDRIPLLRPNQRDSVRRFVLLIDTLYDNRVKLIASAAAEPEALYRDGPLIAEFRRTASRLYEMRSNEYLAAGHGWHGDRRAASLERGCHSG